MEGSSVGDRASERVGRFPVLVLSAWCGLVSGLLEVGTIVLRKRTFDPNHLYEMSRHFVWLIPLHEPVPLPGAGRRLETAPLGVAPPSELAGASPVLLVDDAPAPPGRLAADPRSGLVGRDTGDRRAAGPDPGAACRRLSPAIACQLARRRLSGADPGGNTLGGRLDQGVAPRTRPLSLAGLPQCPPDRAGHGRGRPFEPLRL